MQSAIPEHRGIYIYNKYTEIARNRNNTNHLSLSLYIYILYT